MVEALTQKGYRDQAAALQEEAESLLKQRSEVEPFSGGSRPAFPGGRRRPRPQLPAACPHCGAPVNLNEVTWAGHDRAECAYCGGMITPTTQS